MDTPGTTTHRHVVSAQSALGGDIRRDLAERVRGAPRGVPCEGGDDLECAVRRRGATADLPRSYPRSYPRSHLRVTLQALAVSDVMGEAKVDDNGELGTARYKVLQALGIRRPK